MLFFSPFPDDSEGFTFNTGTIALPDGDKAKAGKQLVNPHIELRMSGSLLLMTFQN